MSPPPHTDGPVFPHRPPHPAPAPEYGVLAPLDDQMLIPAKALVGRLTTARLADGGGAYPTLASCLEAIQGMMVLQGPVGENVESHSHPGGVLP